MRAHSGGLAVAPLGMWVGPGALWWLWGVTTGLGASVVTPGPSWGPVRWPGRGGRVALPEGQWPWLFPAINHR